MVQAVKSQLGTKHLPWLFFPWASNAAVVSWGGVAGQQICSICQYLWCKHSFVASFKLSGIASSSQNSWKMCILTCRFKLVVAHYWGSGLLPKWQIVPAFGCNLSEDPGKTEVTVFDLAADPCAYDRLLCGCAHHSREAISLPGWGTK